MKGGEKLKSRSWSVLLTIIILGISLTAFPEKLQAYTDLSIYKVETGSFVDRDRAEEALVQLKTDTGWNGYYETTGDFQEYYQIMSGGFSDRSRVKRILADFEESTGID